MALQFFARVPRSLFGGLKHTLSQGRPPATSFQAERLSSSASAGGLWRGNSTSSPRSKAVLLGKVALGAALGVSTAVLFQSFHTGAINAMALKVDLDSPTADWKETKDLLLSLSVTDRRQHYRTPTSVPLEDVPVWTPTAGGFKPSSYKRNEKLDGKISVYSGDITKLEIDAIVNAANNSLLGGGGVDGAIHRAAGPLLKKECASLHGCETGQAKITCGYGLPAKYVIHTVGPIAQGGVGTAEKQALKRCYLNSLRAATDNAAHSVAFPCISTGIYGYPPEKAVHVALATVREYLDEHHDKLDRVIFCVFLPKDKELYLQYLPLYFPDRKTCSSLSAYLLLTYVAYMALDLLQREGTSPDGCSASTGTRTPSSQPREACRIIMACCVLHNMPTGPSSPAPSRALTGPQESL